MISYCYNTGQLYNQSGAISGHALSALYNASTLTSCYALEGIGSTLYSEWDNFTGSVTNCSYLTQEQMKLQASFVGWDFVNVWQIEEDVSYPTLRNIAIS